MYSAAMASVALVTCSALPDLDDDESLVVAPLAARGVDAEPVVWDDPAVPWDGFDLTVIRSAWDYAERRTEFVAWAHSVPRLANPAGVVEGNTDKRYLRGLAEAGVPVVDTTWLEPGDPVTLPGSGRYVLKPSVSAGSRDTGVYRLDDPAESRLAHAHAGRLLGQGRAVMVQPYLAAVDTVGETALLYIGGAFSHAVAKAAMLDGPHTGDIGLFRPEKIDARTPSPEERATADAVLDAAGATDLLYARVDLVPGADGRPRLIELELTEPSLFLPYSDGAPERLAEAIVARL